MVLKEVQDWYKKAQAELKKVYGRDVERRNLSPGLDNCIFINGKPFSVIIAEKKRESNGASIDREELLLGYANDNPPAVVSMYTPKYYTNGKVEFTVTNEIGSKEKSPDIVAAETKSLEALKKIVFFQHSKYYETSQRTSEFLSERTVTNDIGMYVNKTRVDKDIVKRQAVSFSLLSALQKELEKPNPNYNKIINPDSIKYADNKVDTNLGHDKQHIGYSISSSMRFNADGKDMTDLISKAPDIIENVYKENYYIDGIKPDLTEPENLFSNKASFWMAMKGVYDSLDEYYHQFKLKDKLQKENYTTEQITELEKKFQDKNYATAQIITDIMNSGPDALRYSYGDYHFENDKYINDGAKNLAVYLSSIQANEDLQWSIKSHDAILKDSKEMASKLASHLRGETNEALDSIDWKAVALATVNNKLDSVSISFDDDRNLRVSSVDPSVIKGFEAKFPKWRDWDSICFLNGESFSDFNLTQGLKHEQAIKLKNEIVELNANNKSFLAQKKGDEYPRTYTYNEETKTYHEGDMINQIPEAPSEPLSFKVKRFFNKISNGLFFKKAVEDHNTQLEKHNKAQDLFNNFNAYKQEQSNEEEMEPENQELENNEPELINAKEMEPELTGADKTEPELTGVNKDEPELAPNTVDTTNKKNIGTSMLSNESITEGKSCYDKMRNLLFSKLPVTDTKTDIEKNKILAESTFIGSSKLSQMLGKLEYSNDVEPLGGNWYSPEQIKSMLSAAVQKNQAITCMKDGKPEVIRAKDKTNLENKNPSMDVAKSV